MDGTYRDGFFANEPRLVREVFVDFVQTLHLGTGMVEAEGPLQARGVLFRLAERPKLHLVDGCQGRAEMARRTLEGKRFSVTLVQCAPKFRRKECV